jgi:outer membrane protein assembly factor BamB
MNDCACIAPTISAGLVPRNKLWREILLVYLVALGGCASTDESIPDWAGVTGDAEPAKLVEFSQTAKFEIRWHSSVGSQGADLLQTALTKDAIYYATDNGYVTRLDRATGKQVWRIKSGVTISGGVGSGNGLVIVGGDKGDVFAFDEDGKPKWKSLVSSEVLSVSQVADGIVMVRSGDGRIAGLNAADGQRVWVYERSTPALVVRSHAGVAIKRGVAYAGFAGGKLAAMNVKDGQVLWEVQVSQPSGNTELERISDITSDPVVNDEQVCAIAFQGRIACYDTDKGSPLWSRDISSDKGIMILRRYLYLSDANGSIIALDKTTGSTTWKNSELLQRRVSAPYAIGNFVVVGDFEGYVHGLNIEDGKFAARTELDGGAIVAAPIELDDGLLIQTRGGDIYSLSIK